jgi:hypothetical protein
MPEAKAPKLFLGVHARLVFPKKEDEQAVLDLMRRFSSRHTLRLQPPPGRQDPGGAQAGERSPLHALFGLNTRYADGAIEKAQAILDSARELGQDPRKVVFGGRKTLRTAEAQTPLRQGPFGPEAGVEGKEAGPPLLPG